MDLSRQRNHGTVVIKVNDDDSEGGRAGKSRGSSVCCGNNKPGATKMNVSVCMFNFNLGSG